MAHAIGIIGGTGLYDIDGFENAHPCGACSGRPSHPMTPGAKTNTWANPYSVNPQNNLSR